MENLADQLHRIVTTIDGHPWASLAGGLFIIIVLCLRKDGVFSSYLSYLGERARLQAAQENRRLEMIRMLEQRRQMTLPGVIKEEDREP